MSRNLKSACTFSFWCSWNLAIKPRKAYWRIRHHVEENGQSASLQSGWQLITATCVGPNQGQAGELKSAEPASFAQSKLRTYRITSSVNSCAESHCVFGWFVLQPNQYRYQECDLVSLLKISWLGDGWPHGRLGFDLWVRKIGNGYTCQYSCLENSMDWGAWGYSPWGHKESDMTEWLTFLWRTDD